MGEYKEIFSTIIAQLLVISTCIVITTIDHIISGFPRTDKLSTLKSFTAIYVGVSAGIMSLTESEITQWSKRQCDIYVVSMGSGVLCWVMAKFMFYMLDV